MSGAALLTHLGVSTLEMGAINNALRKHSDGAPAHPIQYSFGPADHGYGLTVRF